MINRKFLLLTIVFVLGTCFGSSFQKINVFVCSFFKEENKQEKYWGSEFKHIQIVSKIDNTIQNSYFYRANLKEPGPLIVSLRTWSADFTRYDSIAEYCVQNNIHYLHPDFQGANNHINAWAQV